MLVLNVRVSVDPAQVEAFEALARELWEVTHRREPGCRRYEYVRLPQVGEYLALMVFDDHAAFVAHQASDHHDHLTTAMRPMMTKVAIEYGMPVPGAFGRPAEVALDPHTVDPDVLAAATARYPAADFGAWPD